MAQGLAYPPPSGLLTKAVTLTAQAATLDASFLGSVAAVAPGLGNATVTLMSAVTAGDGAVQVISKSDVGSTAVLGAANNGSGLIRIQVASTTGLATNTLKNINQVAGCIEANGTWPVTVIDATHFDLQGSTFVNAYVSGGIVYPGRVVVTDGVNDLAWLSAQNDIVALRSNGTSWTAIGWNIAPITEVRAAVGTFTWTKAPLAQQVRGVGIGPGGSGGSGRRGATSSIRGGGGPGIGGAIVLKTWPAAILGAQETITIVDGAPGGSAQTADSTNGNAPTPPNAATFGAWLAAAPGGGLPGSSPSVGSFGGTNVSGGGFSNFFSADSNYGQPAGANSGITTANLASVHGGSTGSGSAGGGADAANAARTPAAGSTGSVMVGTVATGGAAGTAGNPGGNGADITDWEAQIGGGGAGGGFFAASTAGTAGGNGGQPGGGAGGGAAADNGNNSGAGGKGGRSQIRITTSF